MKREESDILTMSKEDNLWRKYFHRINKSLY